MFWSTPRHSRLVDGAPVFPGAIANVAQFLAGRHVLFCSWGNYDKNQLAQDAAHHAISVPFAQSHANLMNLFSRELVGVHERFSMERALKCVGLTLEGTHHRGIDDARNIVRLLPWITGRIGKL